jgi:hypothetical protein
MASRLSLGLRTADHKTMVESRFELSTARSTLVLRVKMRPLVGAVAHAPESRGWSGGVGGEGFVDRRERHALSEHRFDGGVDVTHSQRSGFRLEDAGYCLEKHPLSSAEGTRSDPTAECEGEEARPQLL